MNLRAFSAGLAGLLLIGCASGDPPTKTEPRAEVTAGEDPWTRCAPGATFVQRTHMITRPPLAPNESQATITVIVEDIGNDQVRLAVRTHFAGSPPTEQEQTLPRSQNLTGEGSGPPLEERQTTVTVPAGTFDCRYRKWSSKDAGFDWTIEVWDDPGFPLPYKALITGPRETTVELVEYSYDGKD